MRINLNRRIAPFAMFLIACTHAGAAEPIESASQFEAKFEACLRNRAILSKCANSLFLRHLRAAGDPQAQIGQIVGLVDQWLEKDTVYAMHPVKTGDYSEVFFKRAFVIEDTSGNLMAAVFSYRKVVGTLYLANVSFSSRPEYIENLVTGKP